MGAIHAGAGPYLGVGRPQAIRQRVGARDGNHAQSFGLNLGKRTCNGYTTRPESAYNLRLRERRLHGLGVKDGNPFLALAELKSRLPWFCNPRENHFELTPFAETLEAIGGRLNYKSVGTLE
jgi:hypothetical protein